MHMYMVYFPKLERHDYLHMHLKSQYDKNDE